MKNSYKISLLVSFLLCTVGSYTSSAFAQCPSLRQAAEREVAQVNAQMAGASACKASKLTIKVLNINIKYLDSCRTADPDGSLRQSVNTSLRAAKDAANKICS